jgi:prefoldin subunit 5
MPICEGRVDQTGVLLPCPEHRNDVSVHSRQDDLMLCDACCDFRFPPDCVADLCDSDNRNTLTINSTTSAPSDTPSSVELRCELLCFLQEKSAVMAADHLVKLCSDFYRKDEISHARDLIEQFTSGRLPRRKGSDAARASIQDLLKICLDPNSSLPSFYAKSLVRLPPVDASHCDVSAILKEVQFLRAEIRQSEFADLPTILNELRVELCGLKDLRKDLDSLKDTVDKLKSSEADRATSASMVNLSNEVSTLKETIAQLQSSYGEVDSLKESVNNNMHAISSLATAATVSKLTVEMNTLKDTISSLQTRATHHSPSTMPAVPTTEVTIAPSTTIPCSEERSFASLARELQSIPMATTTLGKKTRRTAICGKATSDASIRAVEGLRRADIFISRLDPNTTTDDVVNLIRSSFHQCCSAKAEKLKTKFDTYASFRAELFTARSNFDELIESVYNEDLWPSGMLVRRYFRPKNGSR